MSSVPCRFGVQCYRADCHFSHPPGRVVSGGGGRGGGGGGRGAPDASAEGQPQQQSRGPKPCWYDRKCNRPECFFSHPNGREMDEQGGGAAPARSPSSRQNQNQQQQQQFDEYEDGDDKEDEDQAQIDSYLQQLEEQEQEEEEILNHAGEDEDSWFPACQKCACCSGFIFKCACQEPPCRKCNAMQLVKSGSVDGSEGKEDAADAPPTAWAPWKDEWYPQSRNCKCCAGYKLKCKCSGTCQECAEETKA